MSPRTLLILGSLAVNAAFAVTLALKPTLAPPAFRDFFSFGSGGSADTGTDASAAGASSSQRPTAARGAAKAWSALESSDLRTLVDRMQAAGFPIWAIRAVVRAKVDANYLTRMRDLTAPDPNLPYWKSDPSRPYGGMDPARMAEYSRLARERGQIMKDLLGAYAMRDDGDLTTGQRRQYGNLSPAKIELVEQIVADYQEMTSQVRAAMQNVTLPEDREKIALLEREKRADLAAVLTPAELEEFDLRNSPTTARLRNQLTYFNASEEEFRAIYRINQAAAEILSPTGGMTVGMAMAQDFMRQRTEAQRQVTEQTKAALGEERYAEFARAASREYQQLAALGEREGLSAATIRQADDVRLHVAQESTRIAADAALNVEQKRAALQLLAQTARGQILAALGPKAGNAHLPVADQWLKRVETGSTITIMDTGTMSYRPVTMPRPPGAGAPGGGTGGVGGGQVIIRQ